MLPKNLAQLLRGVLRSASDRRAEVNVRLRVRWTSGLEEILDPGAQRVSCQGLASGSLQQGACAGLGREAAREDVCRNHQPDRQAELGERLPVYGIDKGTTSECHDHPVLGCQARHDGPFDLPKMRLPPTVEQFRNRHSDLVFDDVVHIHESPPQTDGQARADSGLPRAHKTGQENARMRRRRIQQLRMAVYRLTVEYDGGGWHGWQTQSGMPTIQEALEDALATALRTRVGVVGSGRTDAGVHAAGQVAHFSFEGAIDPRRLQAQLNGILPRSVAVHGLVSAPEGFHARYSAVRRTYRYRTSVQPRALERHSRLHLLPAPDFEAMNRAAEHLLGEHDFSAFCRVASETENRRCRVSHAAWEKASLEGDWDFVVTADRFLHGMVRTIVGTLLEIGRNKRESGDPIRLLQEGDRTKAGPAAPAKALVLWAVEYPTEFPADADGVSSGAGTRSETVSAEPVGGDV